ELVALERRRTLEHREECLLHGVGGVVAGAEEAMAEVEDPSFVPVVERGECGTVACGGGVCEPRPVRGVGPGPSSPGGPPRGARRCHAHEITQCPDENGRQSSEAGPNLATDD